MNRFSVIVLRATVASSLTVPAMVYGQDSAPSKPAAPIRLDGQTLDPGIQAMLENDKVQEAAAKGKPDNDATTAAGLKAIRREVADAWLAGTATPPEMQSVKDDVVKRGGVSVPVRIYRPKATGTLPTIVYYHGGAWFIGGIDASDRSSRQLADDARAIVVSVDYRLAPEAPYPASWDDAENAFEWVVGEATRLGGAPDQVCVAGDSAGGNMAIVVTTRRLAKGKSAPLCQILYYPAVDNRPIDAMRATYSSSRLFGEGFRLDRSFTDYILPIVFPDQDLSQPEVSPLFDATRKMPPTLIATAGFDPLRDSERAYAAKLALGGNTVIYREFPTLIHGFLQHTGLSPAAARASRETAQAAGVLAREAIAAQQGKPK
ncbi:alpha/beta hydrolase [Sphingomonas sp. LT1P40]|uniref:alpha/beta hydrolase n=1 Tax=Alteristakelama amylovorans TaxID=3096166 RepID=UPI002FC9A13A